MVVFCGIRFPIFIGILGPFDYMCLLVWSIEHLGLE